MLPFTITQSTRTESAIAASTDRLTRYNTLPAYPLSAMDNPGGPAQHQAAGLEVFDTEMAAWECCGEHARPVLTSFTVLGPFMHLERPSSEY
jgi:hypothetical protein